MPKYNLRNIMLRPDVVQAVKDGKFHIYAVNNIDEVEVLTGVPAGERGPDGSYPDGSVNGRVEKKLRQFAEQLRQAAGTANPTEGDKQKTRGRLALDLLLRVRFFTQRHGQLQGLPFAEDGEFHDSAGFQTADHPQDVGLSTRVSFTERMTSCERRPLRSAD